MNELVIGLSKKNLFNASQPKDDAQFATFVTIRLCPRSSKLLRRCGVVRAPDVFPRTDLIQVFLTGVPGLIRTARRPSSWP